MGVRNNFILVKILEWNTQLQEMTAVTVQVRVEFMVFAKCESKEDTVSKPKFTFILVLYCHIQFQKKVPDSMQNLTTF